MEARRLYYEASVMIISLINLGHMLETRAHQRSSKALEKLLDLTPPTVCIITDGGEKNMPLTDIQTGMLLCLATDDRVPVDGEITQGGTWLDEATLTGEPIPQQKGEGDSVHADMVIQDGSMPFHASAVGSHTTLSRIIHTMRQTQSGKPEIGRLTDRVPSVFAPVVVIIALVSAVIWYSSGPAPQIVYMLVIATTVLTAACPYALGLATPMSIISGVGRTAEFGVLIRDVDALQHASTLDIAVFNETGTLTEGKPQVVTIKAFDNTDGALAIRLAAALERGFSHPLARTVLDKTGDVTLPWVNSFRTLHGLDVDGEMEGHTLLLDNQALLNEQQVDTAEMEAEITAQVSQESTPILLTIDGRVTALLTMRDPLRSGSVAVLQRLHRNGYRLVVLADDDLTTANAIAREASINEMTADVLPDGKVGAIKRLQNQKRQVAMVGDSINDAPALAQVDVGIAMGDGSDVATGTAAITLMRHSLMGVTDALSISRTTLRSMKQNLVGMFVYNSIGVPAAVGILWPFIGALLDPVAAGAMMALSSITVVNSANRLLRLKPKE